MKLTADQARTLHEIFNSHDAGMNEINSEIFTSISKGRKFIKMSHITNDEAKILLDGGFKIYSEDGHEQYTKPEGFTEEREVSVEW